MEYSGLPLTTTSYDLMPSFNITLNDSSTAMHSSTTLGYDSDVVKDVHTTRIYVKFYALGFLLPFGFFFNTFAFVVFVLAPRIRRTTTGRFLLALSVADNMFLVGK